MTKLLIALLVFIMMAATATAQGASAPVIDVTTIKTYADRYDVKNEIYVWASDAKNEVYAWASDAKNEVYLQHGEEMHAALIKLRTVAFDQYLQWLDASAMMDFDHLARLEREVPEVALYRAAVEKLTAKRDAQIEPIETERDTRIAAIEAQRDALLAHLDTLVVK